MEIKEHIEALRREGELLADSAPRVGMSARVPSCPNWIVRDVVRHQGDVHRWATANLTRGTAEPMDDTEEKAHLHSWPSDDDEGLIEWFREGHAALIETLESVPDDVAAFTWLPAPNARAFWARRQAHETAIHRADVECAGGAITAYDVLFAADGIDELLVGFHVRSKRMQSDPPRRLMVAPTDVPEAWLLEIGPEGTILADEGDPHCTVRGPASDLFLLLWNRRPLDGLEVDGDVALPTLWRESVRVRWS